jgi:predicted nuclease of predicted toxin-antitoxin system
MSGLFIDLYLDEDVSIVLSKLLRSRGFAVTTTGEAGRLGASDDEQLSYAVTQQRCLLTHNRVDFEGLAQRYFDAGKRHCGIIIAVRRSPHEIFRRLLRLLNQVTADEMENQVHYI